MTTETDIPSPGGPRSPGAGVPPGPPAPPLPPGTLSAASPAPLGAPSLPLAPAQQVSSYVQYLPAPYAADPFIGRYLMIAETILGSIERTIDNLPHYFDPRTTPEDFLPWLASWVGNEVDENAPLQVRRASVAGAAGLYRWQGTRRALRDHIVEHTGREPLIVENFDGMRLGGDAMLGVNTHLGEPRPHSVSITVLVNRVSDVDEGVLQRIIEREKPVHVSYTLEIRQYRPRIEPPPPTDDELNELDLPPWLAPPAPQLRPPDGAAGTDGGDGEGDGSDDGEAGDGRRGRRGRQSN